MGVQVSAGLAPASCALLTPDRDYREADRDHSELRLGVPRIVAENARYARAISGA